MALFLHPLAGQCPTTSIQRADSFLAASNISDYSRWQLIIEVLQRFCRILSDSQHEGLSDPARAYCAEPSGQQIYRLDTADVPERLAQLRGIYRQLLAEL